jgi:hypothetical protein
LVVEGDFVSVGMRVSGLKGGCGCRRI